MRIRIRFKRGNGIPDLVTLEWRNMTELQNYAVKWFYHRWMVMIEHLYGIDVLPEADAAQAEPKKKRWPKPRNPEENAQG